MFKSTIAALLALIIVLLPARVQGESCGKLDDIFLQILTEKKQAPLHIAIDKRGFVLELFVSKRTRQWTLVAIDNDLTACTIAEGFDFKFLAEQEV